MRLALFLVLWLAVTGELLRNQFSPLICDADVDEDVADPVLDTSPSYLFQVHEIELDSVAPVAHEQLSPVNVPPPGQKGRGKKKGNGGGGVKSKGVK